MAYTIISQNNSTTTLSDGVNTITVPSRVNLTSGNFTIVEVNNNMATLEDGDGNVYRDIPCVATLAGEGGGGGDQHNLGWYATEAALESAHATAEAGDWAIVGATDTVWVWDTDNEEWVDSDQKGQVTSVNGKTGVVVLNATDVDAIPQYSTMPTADSSMLGEIAQFIGTTNANYTNGYFYKCVSDGQTPATYSWEQTDVQPAGSSLPDQTGKSGEFLTTDGTDASWTNYQNRPFVNKATSYNSVGVGLSTTVTGGGERNILIGAGANSAPRSGRYSTGQGILIAGNTSRVGAGGVAIGGQAVNNYSGHSFTGYDMDHGVAIGSDSCSYEEYSTALGASARAMKTGSIQIGGGANSETGTFCVGLTTSLSPYASNNYKLLDSDGTIPTARLTNAINKYSSMPTAGADYLGQIAQFTGTTDATYTHGYIYECVSDGGNPATYSWTEVSMGGGGSGLPDQTGHSGEFLTTDGTDASWAAVNALQNTATGTDSLTISGTPNTNKTSSLNIGPNSSVLGDYATCVGTQAVSYHNGVAYGARSNAAATWAVAIGAYALASASYAIQLGGNKSNSDANTFKVANANGNFEMMSANGTIPTARLTKVNSTITIAVADWNGGTTVTKTVAGITATGVVLVSPDPTDQSAYTSAGIICTAQVADSLTFTCSTTPSADIDVNVVML